MCKNKKFTHFMVTLCLVAMGAVLNVDAVFANGGINQRTDLVSLFGAGVNQSVKAKGIIIKYSDQGLQASLQSNIQSAQAVNVLSQISTNVGVQLAHKRIIATGAVLLDVMDQSQDLEQLAEKIAAYPGIEYAEPNAIMTHMLTPNDTRYNEQWHYFENTGGIRADQAWDSVDGSGVVVAIIDTGRTSHSDLNNNTLPGYDFISDSATARDGNGRDNNPNDEGDWWVNYDCHPLIETSNSSWHGTHVAGTVAAVTNNNKGVAGVAHGAKIFHARTLGKCGGTLADIADAVIWSAGGNVSGVPTNQNPADVINMSLGGSGSCASTYQNAINQARNLGTTVVVAAGNSSANASDFQPANCSGVVTVASTTRDGDKSSFSNYGSVVDLAAPGSSILSTLNNGVRNQGSESYAFYNGTSMATPHVAGSAALLYQAKSNITPNEVESVLKNTARSFPGTCSQCGSGILNAKAAIDSVGGGSSSGGSSSGGSSSGGSSSGGNELQNGVPVSGLSASTGNDVVYTINVPSGASNLVIKIAGGSGDADLYTRAGSAPTDSTYECRPYINGNNETCTEPSPSSGIWYARVKAYSSFSNVTLTASYDGGGSSSGGSSSGGSSSGGSSGGNELQNGVPVSGLSASTGNDVVYTINVPGGSSNLVIKINGGSGDADLYTRAGAVPTDSNYKCRPYANGNNETCTEPNPSSGTWYARVKAYSSFSNVTLTASYNGGGSSSGGSSSGGSSSGGSSGGGIDNACASESPHSGNGVTAGDTICVPSGSSSTTIRYFWIYVPSNTNSMLIRTQHGSGNGNLYYKASSWANSSNADQSSTNSGNTESITVNNPPSGYRYVSVIGQQSGMSLRIDLQ